MIWIGFKLLTELVMAEFSVFLNNINYQLFARLNMEKYIKIILSFLFVTGTIILPSFQRVIADGIFEESLPPTTVGDREGKPLYKVSPPILTSDTMQNAFFQLRLFDSKTGNNITNVNYFLTISKGDNCCFVNCFIQKMVP